MSHLKNLKKISDSLPTGDSRMPLLFIGHGSPMNGIENNEFSQEWAHLAQTIPTPKAVLCISAHWFTRGTMVTAMEKPRTIHDFYGFPKALFDVQYPAPGNAELARETADLIKKPKPVLITNGGLTMERGPLFGTCTRRPTSRSCSSALTIR